MHNSTQFPFYNIIFMNMILYYIIGFCIIFICIVFQFYFTLKMFMSSYEKLMSFYIIIEHYCKTNIKLTI